MAWAESDADLERLRAAVAERRAAVARYEEQTRGLFDAIEAVDDAIHALREEVERLEREAAEAQRTLARLEAESVDLEQRHEQTRSALGKRVVALYKAGPAGSLRLVFASGSLRERLGRIQVVQRLADHDASLLARYREEAAALDAAREGARVAAAHRDSARASRAERARELEREREGKRELLQSVRLDRSRERALLGELEGAAHALEETFAQVRGGRAPPGRERPSGFASRRGDLEPPVLAPLLRGFGRVVDEEYRTRTFHKGVDFATEIGDPVFAVAPGDVRYAGWLGGYGRLVILDHGDDYFTVSGHLDEISVPLGARVEAGERLGSAGDTGSLAGPRLYFEIRRGSNPLDPANWLRLVTKE